ncbi:MAG: hypothetical protein KGD63_07420 [Candidatus Lokiarchaeota archaeon]|nr:hypothetical protein [Candidatus Lokiarchaeota archaeon]
MIEFKDLSDEIKDKIREIYEDVKRGKVSLLDLELVPIFNDLKNTLNTSNIDKYSKVYIDACELLKDKFKEFQDLLNSMEDEKKFDLYLKSNPDDKEIIELFNECWIKTFQLQSLSYDFLEQSQIKLSRDRIPPIVIEHLKREKVKENFILELPTQKFTDKMNDFLETIKKKLPCSFNSIFDSMGNQIEIYEKFVYLLHLLQIKEVKYKHETDILYI